MQPSPSPSEPSLFNAAKMAAHEFRSGANTPPMETMVALMQEGYSNPKYIADDLNITDQSVAERVSAVIAGLLAQACEDIGRNDIRIKNLPPQRNEHGHFKVTLAADFPSDNAEDFPVQQLLIALNNLRTEIIGQDASALAPHWQVTYLTDPKKGMVQGYKWIATNEREKKLQALAKEIISLQGSDCTINTGAPVLWVSREGLERMAGRRSPPLP